MLQTPGHWLPRGGGAGTGIPAQQVCTPPVRTGAWGAFRGGGGGARGGRDALERGGGYGEVGRDPPSSQGPPVAPPPKAGRSF